jgi:hypothetical protein
MIIGKDEIRLWNGNTKKRMLIADHTMLPELLEAIILEGNNVHTR